MGFIGPNFNQQPFRPQQAGQMGMPAVPQPGGPVPQGPAGVPRMMSLEAILAPLLMAEMALSPEQTIMLLRNLLKMPKEIAQLLAMLANAPQAGQAGEITPQQLLQALLAENPHILLEDLQTLMQEKTKDGTGKLLAMLQQQQASTAGQGGKELGDMLKQLTQLSTRVQSSPTEALNQMLMLYLPWFPLESPVKMQLYFEAAGDGEEDGQVQGEEYNLILLLETLSMGKFKIVIGVRDKIRLLFRIRHDPLAAPYLADLQGALLAELSGDALPPPVIQWEAREAASVLTQPQSGVGQAGPSRQSLGVHPLGGASVLVVNAAYVAARVILEADRRNALIR